MATQSDYKFPDGIEKKRQYKADLEAKVNDTLAELDALNVAILADVQELVGDEYTVQPKAQGRSSSSAPRTPSADIDVDAILDFMSKSDEPAGAGEIAMALGIKTGPKLSNALKGLVETEQLRAEGERRGRKYRSV
jgi:hypothetical protein